MTTTKVFASKLTVAFVAAAMVVSFFAPAAQAQTTEELQAMINDLLAQVAALQGGTEQGTTGVPSGICPYTWTRSLTAGSEGADVQKLQQFLNSDLDTRVSASGAGSVGAETMYFGPATAAAVSKFQVKYRTDILSPVNLVNPTGYFGPSSIAKANALCALVTDTDGEDTDGEDTDSEDVTLGGEADLDTFEIDDADDSTIDEGTEDAEVAEITVNFTDGDASISRLDLAFTASGANPWDAFDTISLWVDGDKVAEADASSKGDYLGDEDDGIIRFSGLDIVGMEDEDVVITVAASIQNNLDASELNPTWTVDGVSMRYFDADGVATTEDGTIVTSESATFDFQTEGTDDEILVKSSSNDPDASTLQVEDNKKSDWYTVFVFDLDTKDSINDIILNNILVDVTMSSGTYDLFVDDAKLVIDGVTIDSSSADVTNGTTSTATIDFNVDGDVTIDAGDKVSAELMLRFKSLTNSGNEGVTVTATVDADDIDAEGADELSAASQLSGVATSDAHTLRTTGIDTTMTDDSAVVTTGDNAGDDYATFEIEVEVTAFEQDVYISTNVATSVDFDIVDGAGSVIATGTTTPVLSSSADENSGYFEITEGETETITLQVTFDAATAGTAARLQLNSISFAETATTPDQTQTTLPATDYRTSIVTLVN